MFIDTYVYACITLNDKNTNLFEKYFLNLNKLPYFYICKNNLSFLPQVVTIKCFLRHSFKLKRLFHGITIWILQKR